MDNTLILTKTAKGLSAAKTEDGDLNYDAVRLLRVVNGKANLGELRPQFEDLTDARFLKAVATLERKGLVRALGAIAQPAADRSGMPQLDAQIHEVEQEVLQTLDFSKLERNLLDAMRTGPPQAAAAAPTAATRQPRATQPAAAARAHPEPADKVPPAREAETRAQLMAALRPHVEAELRASLMDTLRPEIEDELRRGLVVALRPALEAEIRAKLTAALKPRVERELRARLESQGAHAAQPQTKPGRGSPARTAAPRETSQAAATAETMLYQRLLECIRETVFQIDLAGNSVYVNPRWTKLSGYPREETLGKPFAQFFVPQDQRKVADYLTGIARGTAAPVMVEACLARKVGAPLRVALRAAPLTATSGAITGVCGTLRAVNQAPDRATQS